MLDDPRLQVAQWLAVGGLGGELRAELRLAAGAAEEEHQLPRDLERDVRVRGPPRRGRAPGPCRRSRPPRCRCCRPARRSGSGSTRDAREPRRERPAPHPVRRGAAAVEQSRVGEDEAPGADRAHSPRARREAPDAGEERPIARARLPCRGRRRPAAYRSRRARRRACRTATRPMPDWVSSGPDRLATISVVYAGTSPGA